MVWNVLEIPNTWNQGNVSKTKNKKQSSYCFDLIRISPGIHGICFPLLHTFLLFAHFLVYLVTTLLGLQCSPNPKAFSGRACISPWNWISSPASHIQKHCILRLNTPCNEKLSLFWKELWKQLWDCRIGDLFLLLWNLSIDEAAREETRVRRERDRRWVSGKESRNDTANRESLEKQDRKQRLDSLTSIKDKVRKEKV